MLRAATAATGQWAVVEQVAPDPVPLVLWPAAAKSRPRIACLIPAVLPKEEALREAVLSTWGADCDVIKFFVASCEPLDVAPDTIDLATEFDHLLCDGDTRINGTSNLIYKGLALVQYAATYFQKEADYFCRVDIDTVFRTDHLRLFLLQYQLTRDWVGWLGTSKI